MRSRVVISAGSRHSKGRPCSVISATSWRLLAPFVEEPPLAGIRRIAVEIASALEIFHMGSHLRFGTGKPTSKGRARESNHTYSNWRSFVKLLVQPGDGILPTVKAI